jgi:xylulokinase
MAPDAGLRAGTPVVAGCGDTSASFLAAGAASAGICIDVAGTASVFGATTHEFLADSKGRLLGCGRSVIPGLWHPYAYINGGGQNLEWFQRDILGGRLSLAALDADAADSTNDPHLAFFVPHLGGRVSPAWPNLRGGWANVSWDAKPSALYRSILESVALEYALYRNALVGLIPGFVVRELRVTGGGEKSRVWNQLKADRLQARVVSIARSGGAPMGLALLAGRGAGVFADLAATVDKWVGLGAVFPPDPAASAVSDARANRYRALLDSLHHWSGGS